MRWITCFIVALAFPLLDLHTDDFKDLFNGKDLDGWVIEGAKTRKEGDATQDIWSVRDGLIVCDSGRSGFGFLRYDRQQYSDFTLHVEYRFLPQAVTQHGGNSGLGIRTIPFDAKKSRDTRPSFASYEIQLLDDAGKPANKHCSGSLYRYAAPTENPTKLAPEWNVIDVECAGPRIKIVLNGVTILDVDQATLADLDPKDKPASAKAPKEKPLKGYVCLQSHSGTTEFRNVRIKELPPAQ